jgi:hypothetical protein
MALQTAGQGAVIAELIGHLVARRLLHPCFFLQITVQEGSLDVHLVQL